MTSVEDAPMTIPSEYQRASVEFEKFMVDARDLAGLSTTNMAYNMVVGVLHTFRRRLTVNDALRFAQVLPPVLRALFVADWDTEPPPLAFADLQAMTREVQSLRRAHNFAPDTAIHDVATALRRHVPVHDLDRVLATLPDGARAYWSV
jgi:uncharacterized protein (DUF2267 family)